MDKYLYEALLGAAGTSNVLLDEPMMNHTTFRIGGPADYFVTPDSDHALGECIRICREAGLPWHLIGNGSNLLVGDKGVRGVVLQNAKNMNKVIAEGNTIHVQAGARLYAVAKCALNEGLTGLEFAAGIPGTLGGAIVMNAGAYGGEMKDVTVSVRVLDTDGTVQMIPAADMQFGYRTSIVSKQNLVVVGANLHLERGDAAAIAARMEELKQQRISKQPLDKPSAGSTFKRPEGYFAGKLIQDAGLAGKKIGGAMVSAKHCGFVVNDGDATARDVTDLIEFVQEEVRKRFDVELEPEVKMLGEFA